MRKKPAPHHKGPTDYRTIVIAREAYVVVEQAVRKLRLEEKDMDIQVGRALELICADWLAGH